MDDIHIQERVGCRMCGVRKLYNHDGLCIKCLAAEYEQRGRMMRDSSAAAGRYLEERDEAINRNIDAKFAIGVLRDALLAYMEPAGEDTADIRMKAKSALRFAERAFPYQPTDGVAHDDE